MNTRLQVVAIAIVLLGVAVLWLIMNQQRKRKKSQLLKRHYEEALAGGDQRVAILAGINYYGQLQDREITNYEYEAIMKGIAEMK